MYVHINKSRHYIAVLRINDTVCFFLLQFSDFCYLSIND